MTTLINVGHLGTRGNVILMISLLFEITVNCQSCCTTDAKPAAAHMVLLEKLADADHALMHESEGEIGFKHKSVHDSS